MYECGVILLVRVCWGLEREKHLEDTKLVCLFSKLFILILNRNTISNFESIFCVFCHLLTTVLALVWTVSIEMFVMFEQDFISKQKQMHTCDSTGGSKNFPLSRPSSFFPLKFENDPQNPIGKELLNFVQ